MKKIAIVIVAVALFGMIAAAWSAGPKKSQPFNTPHSGMMKLYGAALGATGQIVTTTNKNMYPSPSVFNYQTLSKSYTSSAVSVFDQVVSSGSATGVMTASGSGTQQIFYAYSSSLDGTMSIYGNTSGTGSALSGGTMALIAGNPYQWDNSSGTTTFMLSGTNSIVFVAGTTAGGLTTTTTATTINAASYYP